MEVQNQPPELFMMDQLGHMLTLLIKEEREQHFNGVAVGSNATGGSFQEQAGDLTIGAQGIRNV